MAKTTTRFATTKRVTASMHRGHRGAETAKPTKPNSKEQVMRLLHEVERGRKDLTD